MDCAFLVPRLTLSNHAFYCSIVQKMYSVGQERNFILLEIFRNPNPNGFIPWDVYIMLSVVLQLVFSASVGCIRELERHLKGTLGQQVCWFS